MSLSILPDDEVSRDIDGYITKLATAIDDPKLLTPLKKNCPTLAVKHTVDYIHEYYVNYVSHLKSTSPATCRISWTVVLSYLSRKLSQLVNFFQDYSEVHIDADLSQIELKIGSIFVLLNEVQLYFFTVDHDITEYLSWLESHRFSQKHHDFIYNTLENIENNFVSDSHLLDNSKLTLELIIKFTTNLFLEALKTNKNLLPFLFISLVKILQCIYECDQSSLILPLLKAEILSPQLPIQLSKDSKIDFNYILDYYIYVAFNLFCLSFDQNRIYTNFAVHADIYFKVYLSLPSSAYNLYITHARSYNELNDNEVQVVLPDNKADMKRMHKRLEVSILFIHNRILMTRDLEDLMSPSNLFKNELDNFAKNLSSLIAISLRTDVNNHSTASLSGMSENQSIAYEKSMSQTRSIGSIIHKGTYKEKYISLLRVVQCLCNLNVANFTQCYSLDRGISSEFSHIYELIEPTKFPGKIKYFNLVGLISKLLRLLSLKFFVKTIGANILSFNKLKDIVGDSLSNAESVLNIKPLLAYTIENNDRDRLFKFSVIEESLGTDDDIINHQLELVKQINDLETIQESNIYESIIKNAN